MALGMAVIQAAEPIAASPDMSSPVDIRPGQRLADVLQTYRSDGFPLAWSSRLVPPDLQITIRPSSADPLVALEQVLAPHDLELRRLEGIFLIARSRPALARDPPGRVMVIARDQNARLPDSPVFIKTVPPMGDVRELGWGVFEFRNVQPGRYRIILESDSFEPAIRWVRAGDSAAVTVQVRLQPRPAALENVTVTTSRYVLFDNSRFFIDQRAIQGLPDIGDDPIRAVHRLPGAAAGGWSSPAFFRGGGYDETAIHLNGLRLLDPFHVRDFHNVFSALDARSIAGVQAYTGGFPARYGDRMSGVLLLESQQPDEPRHYEIGVSVFNTSVLASGFSLKGERDWLVSARRSNLDLVLDKREHGQPSYNDVFGQFGFEPGSRTRVSLNFLRASDHNLVITESKPEEEERATSDTLNQSLWVQAKTQWSDRLSSETVASWQHLENLRNGLLNDPEQLVGSVRDEREVSIKGLSQDWEFEFDPRHLIRWGWEYRRESAVYRYAGVADYAGFYLIYPGVPEHLERHVSADPKGHAWSAYGSERFRLTRDTTLEAGIRWDRQNWSDPVGNSQWSPRVSILHSLSEDLDLRLTWGTYNQSQGIHRLQVEDGIDRFFPAQESSHFIGGLKYRLSGQNSLRVEAYAKQYDNLRPRFENLLDPLPLIPELEPDRIRVAPDSARARGIEITWEHESASNFDWWATYAWSRVEDRIDGRWEPRNWDQRHALQAGLTWESRNWQLGLALKAHTGWPTTAAKLLGEEETAARLVFGPRNARNLNSFFNLDLRVARLWTLSGGRLTVFFEVVNLTNRRNECCVDYDGEFGDDDVGPLELERSVDHWLGLTPAVGVLWEF